MTLKAHKIQLIPKNKQAAYFAQAAGVSRFAYNWALAEWQRQYEAGGGGKLHPFKGILRLIKGGKEG